ncbi:hypothetical protein C8R43DRAFT_1135297 [Mycena crocata]|nr:hypothetical protein C8R43DRAFT_1135297 [Mycena crocata]
MASPTSPSPNLESHRAEALEVLEDLQHELAAVWNGSGPATGDFHRKVQSKTQRLWTSLSSDFERSEQQENQSLRPSLIHPHASQTHPDIQPAPKRARLANHHSGNKHAQLQELNTAITTGLGEFEQLVRGVNSPGTMGIRNAFLDDVWAFESRVPRNPPPIQGGSAVTAKGKGKSKEGTEEEGTEKANVPKLTKREQRIVGILEAAVQPAKSSDDFAKDWADPPALNGYAAKEDAALIAALRGLDQEDGVQRWISEMQHVVTPSVDKPLAKRLQWYKKTRDKDPVRATSRPEYTQES